MKKDNSLLPFLYFKKTVELCVPVSLYINPSFIAESFNLLDIVNKLNYFGIDDTEDIIGKVTSKILQIENEITQCNTNSVVLTTEITNISNKLKDVDLDFLYDDLMRKEFELDNFRKRQQEYKSLYIQNIGTFDLSENSIISITDKINADILLNNDIKIKLFRIRESISALSLNIDFNDKKATLTELEKSLVKFNSYKSSLEKAQKSLSAFLINKINTVFNHDLINDIYQKIDPHPQFKSLKLIPSFENEKPELLIKVFNRDGEEDVDPLLYLSSAQVNILSLSIFLAKSIQNNNLLLDTILMDDPVQYLDSINILSFIDLMRAIISDKSNDRQVIISTHDENFFKLLQKKFDSKYYNSKFIEFESYGRLKSQSIY